MKKKMKKKMRELDEELSTLPDPEQIIERASNKAAAKLVKQLKPGESFRERFTLAEFKREIVLATWEEIKIIRQREAGDLKYLH